MEYVKIKRSEKIVSFSNYVVSNPEKQKNNWSKLFQNNNPIDLELGMGRGDFIISMAKKYPNRNFIGLEISSDQMAFATEKLNRLNLKNIKLICADASNLLDYFSKEIDTIYLTFSEPWPKKKDEKKRFTHPVYLKLYDRIFKKDKHIILKTDNKGLFQYSLESLSQYWYIFNRVSLDLNHNEEEIPNVMTDWEKQCNKMGKPIFYIDAKFEG